MTIAAGTPRADYTAPGGVDEFAFTFEVFLETDVAVYLDDVLQASGYTVVLEAPARPGGVKPGGTVTFTVAPDAGVRVALVSAVPFTQPAQYPTGQDKFPAVSHENALDRAIILAKQVEAAFSRVIRTGLGDPEGAVTAPIGTLYLRLDGGAATTLYVKESGTADTGWVAK